MTHLVNDDVIQDIQVRLPAALESGRMVCYVGDMATPASRQIADEALDRSSGVESGVTLRQALRLLLAAAAGRLSGAASDTIVIRDVNNTKARITATVDVDGNRLAITVDPD